MHECEKIKSLPSEENLEKAWRKLEEQILEWDERVWERKQRSIEREIERNEGRIAWGSLYSLTVNLNRWRCREVSRHLWRKVSRNLTAKTPPGDFQVTTSETLLLSQQAVTSKGISSTLPTYSWTLTPISNWTCSVVTVPLSNAQLPSTWLTNCADPSTRLQSPTKKIVGCKVL